MHGLIFFYIQKFAEVAAAGTTSWSALRSTVNTSTGKYLPSGVYPDADAVQLLESISQSTGRSLPKILEQFGEFLAPHLVKVAGKYVDPSWRTLDLIENTESIIHSMVRTANPGAAPPVLETVRPSPGELHLVYSSKRQLCPLATGLIRGMAKHYGEQVAIEEPSCMLRGDPFCSFVVQIEGHDTHESASPLTDTTVFLTSDSAKQARPFGTPSAAKPGPDIIIEGRGEGIPATVGGYTIMNPIGQGGMGRVYLARDEKLQREVAIKMLHPSKLRDPLARERFLREGRATAAVDHPHVMTIHQVGEDDGQPYIVMQRLVGRTLKEYRDSIDVMPLPEILRIGRETAEGLAAAHRRGLIHRDIKPNNIFLQDPGRQVKIIDFGLARDTADDVTTLTADGAVVGTPAYMSPERIGERQIDAKSDLFGLGVILYELLANRLPFEGTSMVSMLAAISRGQPKDVREAAPGVPENVARLVMRLIAHDKADRPADADAVAKELAALEHSLPQ